MTGYGRSQVVLENGKLTVELRSVNGKSADINIKTQLLPKDKEMPLRKKIADTLKRGTIDMFLTWEPNSADNVQTVNTELALEYYSLVESLASRIPSLDLAKADPAGLLSTLLRMPDVVSNSRKDVITEENWPSVETAIDEAISAIDSYRSDEGRALYADVTSRVSGILDLYDQVEAFESERIEAARERILKAARDLALKLDPERLEQEMVYYLEKLDINEEKVRLRQHCRYFFDTIDSDPCPGKKLGFIIQEMGREINTTGSKANHAGIQKLVVQMKDELEKIREQSMNIL